MKPPDTSEQSPLCSDVLLFLWNKRTSSARSLAPPFQITTAAQPLAALPPYGCGVPLAGASLGCDLVEKRKYSDWSHLTARPALILLLLASEPDSLRWIPVCVRKWKYPD